MLVAATTDMVQIEQFESDAIAAWEGTRSPSIKCHNVQLSLNLSILRQESIICLNSWVVKYVAIGNVSSFLHTMAITCQAEKLNAELLMRTGLLKPNATNG